MNEVSNLIDAVRASKRKGEVCDTIIIPRSIYVRMIYNYVSYPEMPRYINSGKLRNRKRFGRTIADQIAKTVGSKVA